MHIISSFAHKLRPFPRLPFYLQSTNVIIEDTLKDKPGVGWAITVRYMQVKKKITESHLLNILLECV